MLHDADLGFQNSTSATF